MHIVYRVYVFYSIYMEYTIYCTTGAYVFYFPFSLFFGLQCKWHIFHGFDISAIYASILDQKRRNIYGSYILYILYAIRTRLLQQKTERLLSQNFNNNKNIHKHIHTVCIFIFFLI